MNSNNDSSTIKPVLCMSINVFYISSRLSLSFRSPSGTMDTCDPYFRLILHILRTHTDAHKERTTRLLRNHANRTFLIEVCSLLQFNHQFLSPLLDPSDLSEMPWSKVHLSNVPFPIAHSPSSWQRSTVGDVSFWFVLVDLSLHCFLHVISLHPGPGKIILHSIYRLQEKGT